MTTVFGIYIFIMLGYTAKKVFNEIEGKTLVLLSTYFLQPFLTLWGIMLIPINTQLILSPLFYLIAVFTALAFTYAASSVLNGKKEKIIASLTPLIGNTGNLGIPLSYALFGNVGASIATMVNLANIFFIYSFGVFFFASGKYPFKEAFKKIVKIPVMWFGLLALVLNLQGVVFDKDIMKIFEMGAFASIVMQLLIFGVYVAEIKTREIGIKFAGVTVFNKFVVFPVVSFVLLKMFALKGVYFKTVMLEVFTPLAVTNVNLAALFDLYPKKVAMLVIITSLIFLPVVFFLI